MKAYVFPGQGVQFPGMGKDLFESQKVLENYLSFQMIFWGLIFLK